MVRMIAILVLILQVELFAQAKPVSPCEAPLGDVNTFAVVYYADSSLAKLAKFDMVVLDPANYDSNDISKLKTMGCIPVAYMNVGEVETYRSYFDMVDTSIIISPDPDWRDRYYVDICDPSWTRIVLKERLPKVMEKGFCGVFLDFSGALNEYPDMDSCAVSLVKRVRREVGNRYLVLDGARPIMEGVGAYVDAITVEGLMGYYDFDSEQYQIRGDSVEDRESNELLALAKKYKIKIFQLDYAAPADSVSRDDIIIRSRQLGFVPYVGTIELDTLFTETVHRIRLPDSRKKHFPD